MNVQQDISSAFQVSIRPITEHPQVYSIRYVPRQTGNGRTRHGVKLLPNFDASVVAENDEMCIQWHNKPTSPHFSVEEFDEDVRRRIRLMRAWLDLIAQLIDAVRTWAAESDWSTRMIEKKMEDSEIGTYMAPALLMQREVTKVLLEPIARDVPGSEGLVDVYFLPGLDDVARLCYYNKRWHLRYQSPPEPFITSLREGKTRPFTKANFVRVIEEMRRHVQRIL